MSQEQIPSLTCVLFEDVHYKMAVHVRQELGAGEGVLEPLNSKYLPFGRRDASSFSGHYLLGPWSLEFGKIDSYSIFTIFTVKTRESIKQNYDFCNYQIVAS